MDENVVDKVVVHNLFSIPFIQKDEVIEKSIYVEEDEVEVDKIINLIMKNVVIVVVDYLVEVVVLVSNIGKKV